MEHTVTALLQSGQSAAEKGHRAEARRAFRSVLSRDPANLPALLWMVWLSEDPRASLAYARRALEVEPRSDPALAAWRWARSRQPLPGPEHDSRRSRKSAMTGRWSRAVPLIALGSLLAFAAGILLVVLWYSPQELPVLAALAATPCPTPTWTPSATSTLTPTPTPSSTPSPTPTATPCPTSTPTDTPTPTPTQTPTPTPTPTVTPSPRPTATPRPTQPPASPTAEILSPAESSVGGNVRWIDVDLSSQTLTAYEGRIPVRSTPVSTGLPRTPTPTGQYHIYVKLRSDHMTGPGYSLPNVPYTMYFYRGYGIHGTYWHSNFGHPMSHGCINLPTDEAQWLYYWASVGTLVNIHW